MDNKEAIAAWRARREKRLAARPMAHKDTETSEGTWVTIKGTPVLIDDKGNVKNNFKDKGAKARLGGKNMKDVDTGKQKQTRTEIPEGDKRRMHSKIPFLEFEMRDEASKYLAHIFEKWSKPYTWPDSESSKKAGQELAKLMPKSAAIKTSSYGTLTQKFIKESPELAIHHLMAERNHLMDEDENGKPFYNKKKGKIAYGETVVENNIRPYIENKEPTDHDLDKPIEEYLDYKEDKKNVPMFESTKQEKAKKAQEALDKIYNHLKESAERDDYVAYINGEETPLTPDNVKKVFQAFKGALDKNKIGKEESQLIYYVGPSWLWKTIQKRKPLVAGVDYPEVDPYDAFAWKHMNDSGWE